MDKVSKPTVFVIVLNYNGADTLAGCLSSIYQSDYLDFEVVVVDNASKDNSLEKARKLFSRAHFIKNSANLGLSRANNMGIRYALEKFADYVFILNNDAVIEKNLLSSLVKTLDDNPKAGAASPLIMSEDNSRVWFAGGTIDWCNLNINISDQPGYSQPYATQYLSSRAMFIKKDVFKKIGLFDERFFLYYEDADFSLRTAESGFDLLVVPSSRIRHMEIAVKKDASRTYWQVLSGLLFFQTHASFPRKIWLLAYISLHKVKNFYAAIFSRNVLAREVRRAYKDFKKISS